MDFQKYIKAVGTGPKGNRDLSFEESENAMDQMLSGRTSPELVTAFLLGWRLKPETIEEYKGALLSLDKLTKTQHLGESLELGFPFDGKVSTPYLFPLVAKILAPFSLNLAVYGDDLQPSKNGLTTKDLNARYKFPQNIFYSDRKVYCKELHDLTYLRNLLGLRTALNTLEKLPNVAHSAYAITGVFHKPYVPKYLEIFKGRYERFALIQGSDGAPELFKKGKLWLASGDQVSEFLIDPGQFGIHFEKPDEAVSMDEMIDVLNDPDSNIQKIVKLNAAIYLFVAGKTASIEEGYERL